MPLSENVSVWVSAGIKTGTTNEAGSCLLFAARYADQDGQKKTIIGVIMGDTNAASLFADSRNLLASAKRSIGLADAQSAGNATQRNRAPS